MVAVATVAEDDVNHAGGAKMMLKARNASKVWRLKPRLLHNAPGSRVPPCIALREALSRCGVVATVDGVDESCNGQIEVTRSQIEKVIERDVPFVLKMADGNEYCVPYRDYIVLPPRAVYVIVFDETDPHDAFDVLPLLTMTGLRRAGNGA